MKKTLIRNIKVLYPDHKLNNNRLNVLVNKGKIVDLGVDVDAPKARQIDGSSMVLIPGLFDSQCYSGEPGFEHKEDFDSLTKAAQNGGFTDLCILPSTNPVIDNSTQVKYVNQTTNGVRLHPIGAISKGLKGLELSEMYDMHQSGACAFSEGVDGLQDINMMKRALDYVKTFDGIIINSPNDERLAPGGMVTETEHNTALGLKSKPKLAEDIMLNRDLYLLDYCESKMHVACITSSGSVKLMARAKSQDLDVTSSVSIAHLLFTDHALGEFETEYKIKPPLRARADRDALFDGIKRGAIDMICSNHHPHDLEAKDREFDHADYGMSTLETLLSAYNTMLKDAVSWSDFLYLTAINPRKRFGFELPKLEKDAAFDFTLFDTATEWNYGPETAASKSANSPFWNSTLIGKVVVLD